MLLVHFLETNFGKNNKALSVTIFIVVSLLLWFYGYMKVKEIDKKFYGNQIK